MAPEYGSPAYLYMPHNLLLFIRYRMGILVLSAVETKDIGHFRVLPVSGYSWLYTCLFHGSALLYAVKIPKRACDVGNPLLNEVEVD
jgi:hypothetical protein